MPTVTEALNNATDRLLDERLEDGTWEGELSPSALSTAVACIALDLTGGKDDLPLITRGLDWLTAHQNADGGWGDTPISKSNISTSLLVAAALNRLRPDSDAQAKALPYLSEVSGYPAPEAMATAVADRYGKDRTFSVPILMALAIGGLLGNNERTAWSRVLPLPFELATFPRSLFAALRLPVVSYALPALIAIGFARFHHAPPAFAPLRALRRWAWRRTSRLLREIQPDTGGYLEATPLTAFVTMALASAGEGEHPVAKDGRRFLIESARPDGSWPIDTDLATWVTSLAAKALPPETTRDAVVPALVERQYVERHPFTLADPGGWSWTPLDGGLPDADDTAGALLALFRTGDVADPDVFAAGVAGCRWLLGVQNRDGGIPTFCRGWGTLPFDRSSTDITAHAIHAWAEWEPHLPADVRRRTQSAIRSALRFLQTNQREDGSFAPLWFGNEHHLPDETNLTYGTAAIVRALATFPNDASSLRMLEAATAYLVASQNEDGGWGGSDHGQSPSTIEETSLALDALVTLPASPPLLGPCNRAADWLVTATDRGTRFPTAPIGFYFAKLWYYEKLYPHIWCVGALSKYVAWREA